VQQSPVGRIARRLSGAPPDFSSADFNHPNAFNRSINDRVQTSDGFFRFEIANTDLIETKAEAHLLVPTPPGTHYHILQNNDYGLVATYSVSGILEGGGKDPYVGATSVVINKTTGEFFWAEAITTNNETIHLNQTHQGKYLHD
jgi:hypothetical protein